VALEIAPSRLYFSCHSHHLLGLPLLSSFFLKAHARHLTNWCASTCVSSISYIPSSYVIASSRHFQDSRERGCTKRAKGSDPKSWDIRAEVDDRKKQLFWRAQETTCKTYRHQLYSTWIHPFGSSRREVLVVKLELWPFSP
jgi:hypothetical protein